MAPSQNADGTPLEDLAGFKIYYNSSRSGRWSEIHIDNPSAITWTVGDLRPGTWYFMMTSLNRGGAESDYTEIVSATLR